MTDPYIDYVSGVAMITASSPIKKNGVSVGVTTVDVFIDTFVQHISSIKVGENGYAFILGSDGLFLGYPDKEKDLNEKITAEKDANLRNLGLEILKDESEGIQKQS